MRPLLALAVCLLLAGCAGKGPSAGERAGKDPDSAITTVEFNMHALLAPPVTTYNVTRSYTTVFAPGASRSYELGSEHTFDWTNSNTCGRFVTNGSTAVWHHGDDTNCDHDSPVHPGTVTVVVGNASESTASTGYFTCEYAQGSASGTSPSCFVSSVAPAGRDAAKGTSIPAVAPAAVLALVALAALIRRRA